MGIMLHLAARFAFWLALFLFVVSAVAPLAGQRPSPPQPDVEELGFAVCQLPCWAGITPGVTPFAVANERMAEHFPNLSIPTVFSTTSLTFQAVNAQPELAGALYYDDGHVSEVHLDVALPLPYLLDTLGTPDCVWVSRARAQIVLTMYWERRRISTGAYFVFDRSQGWRQNTPTRFLQMTTTLSCGISGMLPWKGFARIWRYEADATNLILP